MIISIKQINILTFLFVYFSSFPLFAGNVLKVLKVEKDGVVTYMAAPPDYDGNMSKVEGSEVIKVYVPTEIETNTIEDKLLNINEYLNPSVQESNQSTTTQQKALSLSIQGENSTTNKSSTQLNKPSSSNASSNSKSSNTTFKTSGSNEQIETVSDRQNKFLDLQREKSSSLSAQSVRESKQTSYLEQTFQKTNNGAAIAIETNPSVISIDNNVLVQNEQEFDIESSIAEETILVTSENNAIVENQLETETEPLLTEQENLVTEEINTSFENVNLHNDLSYCRLSNMGINLGGNRYYTPELLFVDLAKVADGWKSSLGNSHQLDLDTNGYPLRLSADEKAISLISDLKWFSDSDEKRYELTYDGEGELKFVFSGAPKVISKEQGKIVFEITTKARFALVIISTKEGNHIRNISIRPLNDTGELVARAKHTALWDGMGIYRYMVTLGTNNSDEVDWHNRKKIDNYGIKHGIAIEDLVKISNETMTSPWITLPHKADDNYFRQAAIYVRDNLNPNLKVYVELSNEVWNWGFEQTNYFAQLGKENGTDFLIEYAKRAKQLFLIWNSIFENDERLITVAGTQFYNPWVSNKLLGYDGFAQQVDALAVGYYIGGGIGHSEESVSQSIDQLFARLMTDELDKGEEFLSKQKQIADTYGVDLVAYEAGQHLAAASAFRGNVSFVNKLIAMNRDPRIYELYIKMAEQWKNVNGKELVWFDTAGEYTKWGSWGILESLASDTDNSPKYKALQYILGENGC